MSLELTILLAAAILLVVAAVLAFVLSRRKGNQTGATPASPIEETFAAYRESHPSFYRILSSLKGGQELNQLLERGDVRAAVRLLETGRPVGEKQEDHRSQERGVLDLNSTADDPSDRTIQAAMLTILRAVYLDDKLRQSLPKGADSELDRLLESLTG